MKTLSILLCLCFPVGAFAQYFHYLHTYDTTGETARNISLLSDNSLLVTGGRFVYSNNAEDAYWMKISTDGNQILDKHHIHTDTSAWYMNYSGNLKPISGGGFLQPWTWYYYSPDPDRSQAMVALVRLNSQLDTISVKRYTDSSLYSEVAHDCAVLYDNSVLLAGYQLSSFISQQTERKAMMMRIGPQGNLVWKQTYVKEPGKRCYFVSVQPLSNNRTLLGGASTDVIPIGTSAYYRNKPWFVIIDNSNGNILRDTLFGTNYAYPGIVYEDQNGGYIHAGKKDSVVTQDINDAVNLPFYIAHLDTNFMVEWITNLPHSYQPYQKDPWRMKQLQNGDFLVCGSGLQDTTNFMHGWAARFSGSGAILWSKYYYSQMNKNAYLTDFVECPDGNIILCGWTRNDTLPSWRGQDLWLLGLYASGEVLTGTAFTGNASVKTMEFSIYPNPASGSFYLEVPEPGQAELYDMSGKQVATYTVPKGKTQLLLDDKIAAGNYLLQFAGKESGMVAGKQLIVNSR